MDIELKTGKRFYEFPSDVAAALIELGLATRIEKPAPVPAQPKWVVNRQAFSGVVQIVLVKASGGTLCYPNANVNPAFANAEEAQAAFTSAGFPVPENVLAEWTRQKGEQALADGRKLVDAISEGRV